jgi:hypothetical protein
MLEGLRQWRFPKVYRIGAKPLGAVTVLLEDLLAGLSSVKASPGENPDLEGAVDTGPTVSHDKDLAELCTSLWRSTKAMLGQGGPDAEATFRRPLRHANAAMESLAQLGLEIVDHTGEQLPKSGAYALKVISFEPKEGLTQDVVLETVRPTILFSGRRIQMGEIIVGTPSDQSPAGGQ